MNNMKKILIVIGIVISTFIVLNTFETSVNAGCCDCNNPYDCNCTWEQGSCRTWDIGTSCGGGDCTCVDNAGHLLCTYCTRYWWSEECDTCYSCDYSCCCTPHACTGCTPTTPSGYSATATGCSQTTSRSCTGNNGCSSCTITKTFYKTETNTTPTASPTSISLTVGGNTYNLSTDSGSPTPISAPGIGDISTISLPTPPVGVIPAGADGWGYGYTVDAQSPTFNSCSALNNYDFCTTSTNDTVIYTPESSTIQEALASGTTGTVSGTYYSGNLCDSDSEFSDPINGYYIVNNEPETDENVVLPTTVQTTSTGCEGQYISGQELANPLPVTLSAIDADGNDQIETLNILFTTEVTPPTISDVYSENDPSTTSLTDLDTFGVMIKKDATEGWTTPRVYVTKLEGTDIVWGRVLNYNMEVNSTDVLSIQNLSIDTTGLEIVATFNLAFEENTLYQNDYNVFIDSLDEYMYDQSTPALIENPDTWEDTTIDWDIDTISPEVESIEDEVVTATELNLTWTTSDAQNSIIRVLGDIYISEDVEPAPLTDNTSGITLTPETTVPESIDISDTHLWNVLGVDTRTDNIDIGENYEGTLNFVVTPFDTACNYNQDHENVDINGWFASSGGMAYSPDEPSFSVPDISTATWIENILRDFTPSTTDITNRVMAIGNLNIFDNQGLGVIAYNTSPNYTLSTDLYSYLLQSFSSKQSTGQELGAVGEECLETSTFCYHQDTDISIPQDFVCDGRNVFIATNNLSITPNITNADPQSGCFFLAGEDIIIENGDTNSTDIVPAYDTIEGYLIAKSQITSNTEADPLEIHGGLLALGLGTGDTTGYDINRSLRLFNLLYPMVAVSSDPRFLDISEDIFGTTEGLYKQEIGFKAL